MMLVSINVSLPVNVVHQGQQIQTGIFKSPVQGSVAVTKMNLAGDGQSDLVNHGGEDRRSTHIRSITTRTGSRPCGATRCRTDSSART
jgi:MOSC domain-containing protein YiiM